MTDKLHRTTYSNLATSHNIKCRLLKEHPISSRNHPLIIASNSPIEEEKETPDLSKGTAPCEDYEEVNLQSTEVLNKAIETIAERAASRDKEETGEKTFKALAKVFNVVFTDKLRSRLNPEDIAIFMVLLKIVRSQNGNFNLDDYVDMAGYVALAAEEASEQLNPKF